MNNQRARLPRVVLAHDWLVGMRGGEWVLDRLARLFGPTDLYTLVNDGRFLTDAIAACNVITSPLQWLPRAAGKWRRAYLPLMPWAVERLRVTPSKTVGWASPTAKSGGASTKTLPMDQRGSYGARTVGGAHPTAIDLLISTSSAVMKSIKPPQGVPHLCYCHSPARYIWEQADEYALGAGGRLRSLGLRAVRRRFQEWDRRTAQADRVTKFIANSRHTAERIARCYQRDAAVVYPPVRTEFFTIDPSAQREDWLLVVSALEPYKRTDMVIAAATHAGWRVKIVGDGSQRKSLRAMAGARVQMLGHVDDATLRDLYRRAKALVFPQVEDFGIIAVEAQACGCPVIAFAGGGAMETVTDETGVFMLRQSPESLMEAVRTLEGQRFDPVAARQNALRFSAERFDEAMLREVDALVPRSHSERATAVAGP